LKWSSHSSWNPVLLLRRYVKAHHISRAALIAAGAAAAILFFVIGAGIRLLIGPVSLGPFAGTLANALDRALPGFTVKYDQAAIEWTRDEGRVNLVILGTRVFDSDGRIIAQAPKADIDLAAKPFLEGKLVVKRIALVGVQLTLVRTADGDLRLGVEKDKQERDILSRIRDAINASNGSASSLESFEIRNARLAFFDETTGLFIVAPQASLRLATTGPNLNVRLNAAVEISGHPAHVSGEFTLPPKKGKVEGAISITGFEIGALAANSKKFAVVKDTALKVDLSASFVSEGSHLLSADFGLAARGEFAVPGDKSGRVRVNSMRAVGRYDGNSGRLLIEDGAIDSDKIRGHLQGRVDFVSDDAGALARVSADVRMDRLALTLPGIFAEPVLFQLVDLRGAWAPATREITIDHLGVDGASLSLQASGKVTLAQGLSPALEVKGTLAPINPRELVRYWPLVAARGAREWAADNMFAGTVGPTTFEIHLPAGAIDSPVLPAGGLAVKFSVSGGEINYIHGLTHLTQVHGTATVTGDAFVADIDSARIGPLLVNAARFVIPNMNVTDEAGDVTGHIQGAMRDVLSLVDMPPLNYPTRFGVTAADTKGAAALDLSVHVPMRKALSVDDVAIGIKAAVSGFSVALGPHTRLTDGTINFTIDNKKLHAVGTTGVGGSPSRVALDWTEDFKTANPNTTTIALKGTLDETARTAMDIHTGDFLKGPVGINGILIGHRGALRQANVTFDLTPATVMFDLIGVNKPAGFPTTARVMANFSGRSVLTDETLRVSGPGTVVTANAKYDSDSRLVQFQAPAVRIGPQNDFSLNLTRSASGLDIVLRGRSLDGSRLARRGSGGNEDLFGEPFHINARLDRLVLRDGVAIAPFVVDVSGVADRPSSLTLSGSLSKTSTLTGSIVATDTGRHMSFATNDTALLTRGLFGFNSLRGGKFELAAALPGKLGDPPPKDPNTPDFMGKMTLEDFRVVDQPFLARLFSGGSLTGLINLMQGQGIAVDTLDVPFSSRNGVISVHDVRATGPAIGITADGYIDRPKNSIALKGSLAPLYMLNSMLGNIPLLGNLLTSKQGEGIIGMTYSVTGNADEPSVNVNPLSVLAPGITRRIFEGKMPNASQAPSNNVPKPVAPPPANSPATTPAPATTPPAPKVQ